MIHFAVLVIQLFSFHTTTVRTRSAIKHAADLESLDKGGTADFLPSVLREGCHERRPNMVIVKGSHVAIATNRTALNTKIIINNNSSR